MRHHITQLREALAAGTVRVELGRIDGRCGYLDPDRRVIALNPDATDEEWAAELSDQLAILTRPRPGRADPYGAPALVHSVDEIEDPAPAADGDQGRRGDAFRVVG